MSRSTVSLDGEWEIVFDPDNKGRARRWHRPEDFGSGAKIERITVPACWETIRKDYEGVAWYRRAFRMPDMGTGRSTRICFDAVNYIADVWLNGSPIGRHEGGYTGFELEIGPAIEPGDNVLILRVLGPVVTQDIVIDGLGKNDAPHWRGAIAGGIWQPVRLETSSVTYVSDVFVKPDLRAMKAIVDLCIEHGGDRELEAGVDVSVHGLGECLIRPRLLPGENWMSIEIPMQGADLWSPDHSHLHTLNVRVVCGASEDGTGVRFGMRAFGMDGTRYTLNGEPLYLKAAFHEGLYPHTLAWPDRALVERELRLARDAGFNMIRPWRKPPPPFVYDLADELGLLFVGSFPIECMRYWPATGPDLARRVEIEIREAILRDRNHASIVQWELFNEISRPELARLKRPMALLARELDPTRMIIDESGGYTGACAYPPGSREPVRYNEVHTYPGGPLDESQYRRLSRLVSDPGTQGPFQTKLLENHLTYVSEIGYGSPPQLEANVREYERYGNPLTPDCRYHRELRDGFLAALKETGFDAVFPDLDEFCRQQQAIHAEANTQMLEAVRLNPNIAGYCLHAFTDGDWVLGAGLLDLFRNPKLPYHAARRSNASRYLAVHVPRTVWAGDEVRITVSLVNETAALDGMVVCTISDGDGRLSARHEEPARAGMGISGLMTKAFSPPCAGTYRIHATLVASGETVAENESSLLALEPVRLDAEAALGGSGDDVRSALESHGVTCFRAGELRPERPLVLGDLSAHPEPDLAPAAVRDFARAGGTVVCLQLPKGTPDPQRVDSQRIREDWLPRPLKLRSSRGLWIGHPHIIRAHAVSRGLPADCIMDAHYESVYPTRTMLGCEGTLIAGTIGYGFWPNTDQCSYLGPEPVIWGGDLIEMSHGRGRFIVSTFRILECLAKKAMAQALLLNLVRYAGGAA